MKDQNPYEPPQQPARGVWLLKQRWAISWKLFRIGGPLLVVGIGLLSSTQNPLPGLNDDIRYLLWLVGFGFTATGGWLTLMATLVFFRGFGAIGIPANGSSRCDRS